MLASHLRTTCALILLLALSLRAEEDDAPLKVVIYPIDRATILAGSKFDFKVEFPRVISESAVSVKINNLPVAESLGKPAVFIEKEDTYNSNKDLDNDIKPEDDDEVDLKHASAVLLRDCIIEKPGTYSVMATDGTHSATVTWEVFETPPVRRAKNVILMIGDGMSMAHRTAARVFSKGIKEGKYGGCLLYTSPSPRD